MLPYVAILRIAGQFSLLFHSCWMAPPHTNQDHPTLPVISLHAGLCRLPYPGRLSNGKPASQPYFTCMHYVFTLGTSLPVGGEGHSLEGVFTAPSVPDSPPPADFAADCAVGPDEEMLPEVPEETSSPVSGDGHARGETGLPQGTSLPVSGEGHAREGERISAAFLPSARLPPPKTPKTNNFHLFQYQ